MTSAMSRWRAMAPARKLQTAAPVLSCALLATVTAMRGPGPTLAFTDLVVAGVVLLLAAASLLWSTKVVGYRVATRTVAVALVAAIGCTVSIRASADPSASMSRGALYLAVLLAGLALGVMHARGSWSIRPWLLAVLASTGPFVTWAFVEMFHGVRDPLSDWYLGVFNNPRFLGASAFVLAASSLALVLLSPRGRGSAWLLSSFGLVVTAGTGTRAGVLCWVLFTILLAALLRQRRVLLVGGGALAVALVITWFLHLAGALTTADIFSRASLSAEYVEQGDLNAISSGRLAIVKASLEAFTGAPWFGQGPDAFSRLEVWPGLIHAHNLAVTLLLEFGVVGCLVMAVLAVVLCLRPAGVAETVRQVRVSDENGVLTATVVALLLYAQLDGTYYWLTPLLSGTLFLGLWFAAMRNPAGVSAPAESLPQRVGSAQPAPRP